MDRKIIIGLIAVALIAVIALAVLGSGGGEKEKDVPATGLTLDAYTLSVEEGSSATIKAYPQPTGCTEAVVWSSSDTSICTVSAGKVSGVKAGSAEVTARCGQFSAVCHVEITKAPTVGEKNALKKAQDLYGSVILFYSEKDMRDQLTGYYGFTEAEADYAMSHLDADWQSQANKQAKRYLDQHMGPKGIEDMLAGVFHEFSEEQAKKAVENLGNVDWQSEAEKRAVLLRDERSYSRAYALEDLLDDGYTEAQANRAIALAYD